MEALNWSKARADFLAAVDALRKEVDVSVNTIADTIAHCPRRPKPLPKPQTDPGLSPGARGSDQTR